MSSSEAFNFGRKIKDLKRNYNKTYAEITSGLKISRERIVQLEENEREPTEIERRRFAEFYGQPPEELGLPGGSGLVGGGVPTPRPPSAPTRPAPTGYTQPPVDRQPFVPPSQPTYGGDQGGYVQPDRGGNYEPPRPGGFQDRQGQGQSGFQDRQGGYNNDRPNYGGPPERTNYEPRPNNFQERPGGSGFNNDRRPGGQGGYDQGNSYNNDRGGSGGGSNYEQRPNNYDRGNSYNNDRGGSGGGSYNNDRGNSYGNDRPSYGNDRGGSNYEQRPNNFQDRPRPSGPSNFQDRPRPSGPGNFQDRPRPSGPGGPGNFQDRPRPSGPGNFQDRPQRPPQRSGDEGGERPPKPAAKPRPKVEKTNNGEPKPVMKYTAEQLGDIESAYLRKQRDLKVALKFTFMNGTEYTGVVTDFTPFTVHIQDATTGEEIILRKLAMAYYRKADAVEEARAAAQSGIKPEEV